jgi:hypothetical protein
MLYLKSRDSSKIKIDKFICIFKESHQSAIFQQFLVKIKDQLESFFSNYEEIDDEKSSKKNKKNRLVHLEEYQPAPAEEIVHKKATFIKDFK